MDADLDPFASTSFVDLLACSLCVAIVLTLFAGSERSKPAPPASAFVSIEESQRSAHLGRARIFAIAIGDLALIAPRMLVTDGGSGRARYAAVHLADTGTCDSNSLARRSTAVLSDSRAFGFDEANEFKKAAWDAYGLDVSVDPNSNVLSLSIARSSDSKRRAPESIRVFIEDSAADTSVSIWTTSSASLEGGSVVLPSPFSVAVPNPGMGRQATRTDIPWPGPIPFRTLSLACVSSWNTINKPVTYYVLLPVKVVTVAWRKTRAPQIEPVETVALSKSIATEMPRR